MRGKPLAELIPEDELALKRARGAGAAPAQARARRVERVAEPDAAPAARAKGFLEHVAALKDRAWRFARRALVCVVLVAALLALHADKTVNAALANLLGTSHLGAVPKSVSTALPLAVMAAIVVTWI